MKDNWKKIKVILIGSTAMLPKVPNAFSYLRDFKGTSSHFWVKETGKTANTVTHFMSWSKC